MFILDNTARIRSIRRIRQPHRSQEQQRAPKPSPTTRIHTQTQFPTDYDRRKLPIPRRRLSNFWFTISLRPCSLIHQSRRTSQDRGTVKAKALWPSTPSCSPSKCHSCMEFSTGIPTVKSCQATCEEQVVEEWAPSVEKRVLRGTHVSATWNLLGMKRSCWVSSEVDT